MTPPNGLHVFGWILFAAGVAGCLGGLLMETTVPVDLYALGQQIDAVQNIGLLGKQLLVVLVSGFAVVAGACFIVAGHVLGVRLQMGAGQAVPRAVAQVSPAAAGPAGQASVPAHAAAAEQQRASDGWLGAVLAAAFVAVVLLGLFLSGGGG